MESQNRRSHRGVPLWVVIVILLDVAILIVAWHIIDKKSERYDSSGFALPDEPQIIPGEDIIAEPPAAESRDPASYLAKVPLRPPPAAQPPPQPVRPAAAPAPRPEPKEESRPMSGNTPAERYYFSLLKAPYFKKSKAIQAWKREFKAYPDLRAINERYHKDHNPFTFMNQAAKSPNFQRMMGKYLHAPDIQKFLQVMAGSPAVVASAGAYMKDGTISKVARNAGLLDRLRGVPAPRVEGQPKLKTFREEPSEEEEQ
ncbi:MAG: hypothetical protein WC728_17110 [Elusimicrobiota bacterium]